MEPTEIWGWGYGGVEANRLCVWQCQPFDNEWPRWVMLLKEAFVTLNLDAKQR